MWQTMSFVGPAGAGAKVFEFPDLKGKLAKYADIWFKVSDSGVTIHGYFSEEWGYPAVVLDQPISGDMQAPWVALISLTDPNMPDAVATIPPPVATLPSTSVNDVSTPTVVTQQSTVSLTNNTQATEVKPTPMAPPPFVNPTPDPIPSAGSHLWYYVALGIVGIVLLKKI